MNVKCHLTQFINYSFHTALEPKSPRKVGCGLHNGGRTPAVSKSFIHTALAPFSTIAPSNEDLLVGATTETLSSAPVLASNPTL